MLPDFRKLPNTLGVIILAILSVIFDVATFAYECRKSAQAAADMGTYDDGAGIFMCVAGVMLLGAHFLFFASAFTIALIMDIKGLNGWITAHVRTRLNPTMVFILLLTLPALAIHNQYCSDFWRHATFELTASAADRLDREFDRQN